MEPKLLSLNEAARMDSDDLYVMNRTKPAGHLNIDVIQNGEKIVVSVPPTFIPVNLTMFATKAALLGSPHFRRMVSINAVRLISDDDAKQLLASSQAKREWQRLFASESVGDFEGANANQQAYDAAKSEVDQRVNPFILNIVGMEDVEEDQVRSMLRGREHEFTKDDWSYLANKSTMQTIKSYAAEQLVQTDRV